MAITELVMWYVALEYKVLWGCNTREPYLIGGGGAVEEDLFEEVQFKLRPK